MNEDQVQKFNELVARVTTLETVIVELCRRGLDISEVNALLAPLDPGVAREDAVTAEVLNQALAALRLKITQPIMGGELS